MTEWQERSRTQAAMLNPALLAALIANAADKYLAERGTGMPWYYGYVVAPLVLHRGTREALPTTIRANLPAWVSDHPVEHAGFAPRALALKDTVDEGIRFALRTDLLSVDEDGCLHASIPGGRGHSLAKDSEVQQIVARAGFVGRWLTKVEQPATVFVLLGVAP